MPMLLVLMGLAFNLINGSLQGAWLFIHPVTIDNSAWLGNWRFVTGVDSFWHRRYGDSTWIPASRRLTAIAQEGESRRILHPALRNVPLGFLPELPRRNRRVDRLGAADMEPGWTGIRSVDDGQPCAACPGTPPLVSRTVSGLPGQAEGPRTGPLLSPDQARRLPWPRAVDTLRRSCVCWIAIFIREWLVPFMAFVCPGL